MARRPAARPSSRRNTSKSRKRSGGTSRNGGNRGQRNRHPDRRLPGWTWLLIGAAVTLFGIVVYHLTQPAPLQKPAVVTAAPEHPVRSAHSRVRPVPVPPKQPTRFSFYKLLPSHEVVIPSAEAERAVKAKRGGKPLPANLAAPGAYIVQVGAFRQRAAAERARARVALLGVEAHTEQVTLSAGDIWYRVRIGPEASLDKAQDILHRLRANGTHAILIKQKD